MVAIVCIGSKRMGEERTEMDDKNEINDRDENEKGGRGEGSSWSSGVRGACKVDVGQ